VLARCGVIDPGQIGTYLENDGFKALERARREMTAEQVVAEVKASGLQGRGGAGFPCGLKWQLASEAPGDTKYIICNADEGEVGAFKDRYILENDPFTLIEGMAIAGYAIGAKQGYIYLRAEYHYLMEALTKAINQAAGYQSWGQFDIEVYTGAGAYVCGEESALMDSIEGKRGEVRYRPPFPPTRGLWGQPTVINNVETLMNIPGIIFNGSRWFSQLGTDRSKGTKVFSVSGDVARPGVYELVMGSPLKELVVDMAGAKRVKMIQIGGAAGRILPGKMMDTPLSFETVLGAGPIIVFNQRRDVIDMVYRTVEFLNEESCGKCVPCRQGTEALVEIMGRFNQGRGQPGDIGLLEELSQAMMLASMCGLGQAAPVPVLDSLQYFPDEYQRRMNSQ